MKKILFLILSVAVCFILTGCGNENVSGSLEEIMDKLYEGISEEELPMMLNNTELNDDNFKSYAFTDADYKEAIASEGVTSQAHSVVLIRLNNASDAKEVVANIKENADPRKWICVEAEKTYVLSKGDLVVLIMSNDLADKIKKNFENLK